LSTGNNQLILTLFHPIVDNALYNEKRKNQKVMAATVAPSHAAGLPSSSGIPAPSHSANSHSHSQDVSGASTSSAPSPLPQTRKFNLRDFRRVRTLGTGNLTSCLMKRRVRL
jgi:hypothetical protein